MVLTDVAEAARMCKQFERNVLKTARRMREQKFSNRPVRGGFNNGRMKGKNKRQGSTLTPVNWDLVDLQPIVKDLYSPHPDVTNRPEEEIAKFRRENNISVNGENFEPILRFDEVNFPKYVTSRISKSGFGKPTAIQSQGWPVALSGRNMVGIAKTGSGKTLAFVLPAIMHINSQPLQQGEKGPIALILAPTRELAQQIETVANEFGSSTHIRNVCVFGGASKEGQLYKVRRGAEIMIATPGRLIDFLESGAVNLKRCSFVVMDEADRMLDMGFEPQIRKIMEQIRPDRQVLMWSATWPKEIVKLANEFLRDYVQVTYGSLELAANHNIKQIVEVCENADKMTKLYDLLTKIGAGAGEKIIIFASTKKRVETITNQLWRDGLAVKCLHGDKKQNERNQVMQEFRIGRTTTIVATDVAARGLDIDDVKYVINFDFPNSTEDYVHRIGRTGRKDNTGTSYTYFTSFDIAHARDLITLLKEANQEVNPKLSEMALRKGGRAQRGGPWGYGKTGSSQQNSHTRFGDSNSMRAGNKRQSNGDGGPVSKKPKNNVIFSEFSKGNRI